MERPSHSRIWVLKILGIHCACGLVLALGLVGASAGPSSFTDDATARKLYVGKCAKCHRFYDPGKYSDAQWQMWMQKMSRKSKLTSGEEELLTKYLDTKRHEK